MPNKIATFVKAHKTPIIITAYAFGLATFVVVVGVTLNNIKKGLTLPTDYTAGEFKSSEEFIDFAKAMELAWKFDAKTAQASLKL